MSALGMRPKYDSVKFAKNDDGAKGTIIEFEDVQMTVYKSNPPVPRFWDEAKIRPMMQTRVLIQVPGQEVPVNLWVKPGEMTSAVRDALVAAGQSDIEIGGELGVWRTGTRPNKGGGGNDAITYRAEYEPPFDPTA